MCLLRFPRAQRGIQHRGRSRDRLADDRLRDAGFFSHAVQAPICTSWLFSSLAASHCYSIRVMTGTWPQCMTRVSNASRSSYLGWQESLILLGKLVEAEVGD